MKQDQEKRKTGRPKARKAPNPSGMGGVYEDRARKGYVAQLCVGAKPNGKPHYVRKRAKSHAEAVELLESMKIEHKAGNLAVTGRKLTLGEWLDRWISTNKPDWTPSAYLYYEATARLHIAPTLGKKALHRVTPADIEALCASLKERGLRRYPSAVYATLRNAMNDAVRLGLVPKSPVSSATPPKPAQREERFLTADQVAAFLEALDSEPVELRAMATVGMLTGLRLGELLGLAWEDMDLESGYAYLRSQLRRVAAHTDREGQTVPAGFELAPLKTSQSRRVLPLSAQCIEAVKMERARQAVIEPTNPLGLAFLNAEGRPWDQKTANNKLKAVCRKAGVPAYGAHALFRHSFATLMLKSGVSLHDASRTLGHSTPTLTGALYGHHEAEAARRVGSVVEEALERAKRKRSGPH